MTGRLVPVGASRLPLTRAQRRALDAERLVGLVRVAEVRTHAQVQAEKLGSVDYLALKAMTGQAKLNRYAAMLAQGDAFLTDELRFFSEIARLAKGEIIADAVEDYRRGR
jgi:hypothetical protein